MKARILIILSAALVLCFHLQAQSDNSIHVKSFPGLTVGQKVAAAQLTCNSASVPCVLILDASLAAFPGGTMPTLCAECSLLDYRSGVPGAVIYAAATAHPGTGTISAAYASLGGAGGKIYLPCGTYYDNITITTGGVAILGDVTNSAVTGACVTLIPAVPTTALLVIQAGASNPIQDDEFGGFNMICPALTACGDAIEISGPANQLNDWHYFHNIVISDVTQQNRAYGFANGINFLGRTLQSEFDRMNVTDSRNAGVYNVSAGIVQGLVFFNDDFQYNANYGIYFASTSSIALGPNRLENTNVQFNGNDGSEPGNCAGLFLSNNTSYTVDGGDFEHNCTGGTAQADIRIAGTYNQAVNIIGATFNQSENEYGIYNDTTQTTGVYAGNTFIGGTSGKSVFTATSNSLSLLQVGPNYDTLGGTYTPDGGGLTHVFLLTATGYSIPALTLTGESSHAGQGLCVKTGGLVGYCSTAVGSTGGCTCN